MNSLKTSISNNTTSINNLVKITKLTGKSLTADGGTVTFTDSSIKSTSFIDPFASIPNIAPSDITSSDGTCTLTFDAQDSAFEVGIAVIN